MLELKKVEDMLEVAIRIERGGIEFYNLLLSMISDPEIKDTMSILAAEEEKHLGTFRDMLDNLADYKPRYKYPGEFESFISGAAERVIDGANRADEFLKANDVNQALNLAISVEMDTILFYRELAHQFESEESQKAIQSIISEERNHWGRLAALKRKKPNL